MAQTIIAALKLGDERLLKCDIQWIEHLLMGYRLPKSLPIDFVKVYYQAARIHLGEEAVMIVNWLSQMIPE